MERRKKREEEAVSTVPGWMLTFNDLMTLLLTFFVLLFSMSTLDVDKLKAAQMALRAATGVIEKGERQKVNVERPLLSEEWQEDILREIGSSPEWNNITITKSTITKSGANIVVRLADTILFPSGVADIDQGAFPLLERISEVIRKTGFKIRIEGHTDSRPIRSVKFPSNWELSAARAVNILRFFQTRGNIPPEMLSAVGYGDSKPILLNDTLKGRAKNRRVEIVLVRKE
jgi:chemotaxis protein MotB